MIKCRISLSITVLMVIGFFFLALPEKGFTGAPVLGGCCDFLDCFGCDGFDCALSNNTCMSLGGTPVNGGVCFDLGGGETECRNLAPGDPMMGCCVIGPENCVDDQIREDCFGPAGDEAQVWYLDIACSEIPQCASESPTPITTAVDIPTMSEWGLAALVGVLGIIALLAIRRKNAVR